jgi:hypothetical protein
MLLLRVQKAWFRLFGWTWHEEPLTSGRVLGLMSDRQKRLSAIYIRQDLPYLQRRSWAESRASILIHLDTDVWPKIMAFFESREAHHLPVDDRYDRSRDSVYDNIDGEVFVLPLSDIAEIEQHIQNATP